MKRATPSPLAVRRFALGFTQGDLGELVGVDRVTIWRYEHGGAPKLPLAYAISRALGTPVWELWPPE